MSVRPRAARALTVLTAAAVGASLAVAPGAAIAGPSPTPSPVTRAAIAPALTQGRGADLGFVEQEAETADTNGTVIGPDHRRLHAARGGLGPLAPCSSPRRAVRRVHPARRDQRDHRCATASPTRRPAAASPRRSTCWSTEGTCSPPTLTSQYAWLYNEYPFSNDPNGRRAAPGLVDHRVLLRAGPDHADAGVRDAVPAQPLLRRAAHPARRAPTRPGPKIRLQVPSHAAAPRTRHRPARLPAGRPAQGRPRRRPTRWLFGADPTGRRDSADAIDQAIAFAKRWHLKVYVPPGTYQVNRHIIVDDVTIEGAGSWYTIFKGHQVTLSAPLPDGSIHTGVGFYGKYAADGGSSNVHLRLRDRG